MDEKNNHRPLPPLPENLSNIPQTARPQQNQAISRQAENMSGSNYKIHGNESQYIEFTLKPGEAISGESMALMYCEAGIAIKMRMSNMGNGQKSGFFAKLFGFGKALATGQRLFMMNFINTTQKDARIAFSMPYIGVVTPINLDNVGNKIICHSSVFMCANPDVKITPATPSDLGGNSISQRLSMQKIEGRGMVFLYAGGNVIEQKLVPGEALQMTYGTILAIQPGVNYRNKVLRNVGVASQPYTLTEVKGPGRIWMQTSSNIKIRENIYTHVKNIQNNEKKKGIFKVKSE